MGNADWNPAQTRVFDVYMANGGGQGGQNLMDIFSCNGGNSGSNNNEGNEDNESNSNSTSKRGLSPGSDSECRDSGTDDRNITNVSSESASNTGSGTTISAAGGSGGTSGSIGVCASGTAGINPAGSPPLVTGGTTELYNSGTGRTAPSLTPEFFECLKRRKIENSHRVTPALNLGSMGPNSVSATTAPISTPPGAATNIRAPGTGKTPPSAAYGQTDKWPNQMESAFISALRIIIKNGTSKFKILDRNYGRNELISLYVEYHTGEVRTKKQISSHIQVWKKSILNKVSGNFKLSSLDHEMLKLIEDGAPQSDEANRFFYTTFEQIVSYLSQQRRASASAVNGSSLEFFRPGTAGGVGTGSEYLLTPATSHHFPLGPTNMTSIGHGGPAVPQFAPASAPVTPIDYAKSIYGNLKTYKCVPVKVQEPLRSSSVSSNHHKTGGSNGSISGSATIGGVEMPPLSQQYIYGGNPNLNLNSPSSAAAPPMTHPLLQSAKDLELQQRQLIENLSTSHHQHQKQLSPSTQPQPQPQPQPQQQPFKLPPVSSELYARASPTQPMPTTSQHLPQLPQLPQLHFADFQPQIYVPVVATESGASNGPSGTKRSLSEV